MFGRIYLTDLKYINARFQADEDTKMGILGICSGRIITNSGTYPCTVKLFGNGSGVVYSFESKEQKDAFCEYYEDQILKYESAELATRILKRAVIIILSYGIRIFSLACMVSAIAIYILLAQNIYKIKLIGLMILFIAAFILSFKTEQNARRM